MERLLSSDFARVRRFLEETAVPCDLTAFGSLVLPAVQRLIPSVVVCYAQIDPVRQTMVAQETYPSLSGFSAGPFDQYMFDHPVFQEWARTGDASAARTSDFYSSREWREFGLYQHVYKAWGCEDSLAVGLPAPRGLIACICSERDKAFSDRERTLMNVVRPHLAQAYRSAELLSLMALAGDSDGVHTMVVDQRGRPVVAPEPTRELIEAYFPDAAEQDELLPQALLAWLTGQMSSSPRNQELPAVVAPLVVHKSDGGRLTLRVLPGHQTGEQAVVTLHEEKAPPLVTLAARVGLTAREQEVLVEATAGRTSAEIADALFISRRTVEKHLENIYGKLGVYRRTAAVARAFFETQ